MGVRDFLTFFRSRLWGSDPSTDIHAKWLKRRVFTQGCTFCSKSRYFSYPLISRPPKSSKFCKFLDLEILRSILAFNIRGHGENTPYSSSEPNESCLMNFQSGGEKLKYILKFYIGVHVTWYAHAQWRSSIVSMSTWCLGRNISETVRDRDLGPKDHQ